MLKTLVGLIIPAILEWITAKIASFVAKLRRTKEVKKQSEESVIPLKEAKTADEIDSATDSTLSGF